MEDNELKQLWASLNKKQEISLNINQKLLENTTDLRVTSLLNSMKPIKIALIVIGILWVVFLDTIIINTFGVASLFFTASAVIQSFLTKLAIGVYFYQLVTIRQVDISQPIMVTQEKISALKTSTLCVARILFLQLPVWSTFYLHRALFKPENIFWLIIQAIVSFALTYLAIWLFVNIKQENKDRKWFILLFEGKEWSPVIKSMELLEDLAVFRE